MNLSAIAENLKCVRDEIEESRKRSLTGEEVKLIAVTKTHGVDIMEEAVSYTHLTLPTILLV